MSQQPGRPREQSGTPRRFGERLSIERTGELIRHPDVAVIASQETFVKGHDRSDDLRGLLALALACQRKRQPSRYPGAIAFMRQHRGGERRDDLALRERIALGAFRLSEVPLLVLGPTVHAGEVLEQIGLRQLQAANVDQTNVIFAGTVLAALPIFLLLIVFQRQLVRGLTAGALKG